MSDESRKLNSVMQFQASLQKHQAIVSGFRCADDVVPQELITQHTHQVLRASMASYAYPSNNGCIQELVKFLLRNRMIALTLANASHFLHLILVLNRGKTRLRRIC